MLIEKLKKDLFKSYNYLELDLVNKRLILEKNKKFYLPLSKAIISIINFLGVLEYMGLYNKKAYNYSYNQLKDRISKIYQALNK